MTDTERLEWVMVILSGNDYKLATTRTFILGCQIVLGLEGREAIDAAIAKENAA